MLQILIYIMENVAQIFTGIINTPLLCGQIYEESLV